MGRSQLFWGTALLLGGALLLANALGIRLPNGTSLTELFWPILLIGFGIWILMGVLLRKSIEVENASIGLQGASIAKIEIGHGAGNLTIRGGAETGQLVSGSFSGGLRHEEVLDGEKLTVKLRPMKEVLDPVFWGSRNQLDWEVALNTGIPITLNLNLGANRSVIDLSEVKLTALDLDTGASDTKLNLPPTGRYQVDLDVGAANLEVVIPEGLSARIKSSVGLGDINIDQARFPKNGRVYQSPDFDSAQNTVDMTIDAGAASIRIR